MTRAPAPVSPGAPAPPPAGRASPAADAEWQDGWWRAAMRVPSPNFRARPAGTQVDLVVLHSISLPPGEYGGPAVEQLFTNTLDCAVHPYFEALRELRVSAHFVIRRDARVQQFVSIADRAAHAGKSAWNGREGCNDWSIGIELEGLEGERFEPAQYEMLARLLPAIDGQTRIAQVVGHEHVAPGRKTDPGAGFDWPGLAACLGWSVERIPPARARPA